MEAGVDLWLSIATWLERGILALLFALSIWSIAIMIDRRRALRSEKRDEDLLTLQDNISRGDVAGIKKWIEAHPGTHAGVLQAALEQSGNDSERIDRAVRSYLTRQRLKFEKGLSILATLGANAPFIGLFGTVLGIIRAFAALGDSSGNASSVMSGISLALIATATGLFVAIPAVVAFNLFSNRLKTLLSQGEALKDMYLAYAAKRGGGVS